MRGCRGEGDQCQGSPTSYTRKLTIINRINTPHGSLKSVCGCGVGGRGCCNEEEISGSFHALMCTLKMCKFSLHFARFAEHKGWRVEGRIHFGVVTIQLSVEHWKVRLSTCWWSSMFFRAHTVSVTFCVLDVHWEVRSWGERRRLSLRSWSELQRDKQLVQLPVPPSAGEDEVSPEVTHMVPRPEETVRFPKRSRILSAFRLLCESAVMLFKWGEILI